MELPSFTFLNTFRKTRLKDELKPITLLSLIVCFGSFQSNSYAADPAPSDSKNNESSESNEQISDHKILEQLTAIHGTNWSDLIKNPAGKHYVKSKLAEIAGQKFDWSQHSNYDSFMQKEIEHNALYEYGHFVEKDQNGALSENDRFFYNDQKKLTREGDTKRLLNLAYSFRNSYSLEGLQQLEKMASETSELSLFYPIKEGIESYFSDHSESENPVGLTSTAEYRKTYQPALEEYKEKFKKLFKENLEKDATKLLKDKESFLKSVALNEDLTPPNSKDDVKIQKIVEAEVSQKNESIAKDANPQEISQDLVANAIELEQDQASERKPASLENQEENLGFLQGRWIYSVILMLLLPISVFLVLRFF